MTGVRSGGRSPSSPPRTALALQRHYGYRFQRYASSPGDMIEERIGGFYLFIGFWCVHAHWIQETH